MQDFNKVNLTDLVKDAILKLDDTTQSLATSFSGDAFPTNNVEKGMTCYRTDKEILYICTGVDNNGANVWEEIGHIGIKPGTDDSGNTISATYTTQATAKAMQNSIDEINTNIQTMAKSVQEKFTTVNTNIQTNKTNLDNHLKDSTAHSSIFSNYLKTVDLTPTMLYTALHKYGQNFVPSDVTNDGWGALGLFISYYDRKVLKNQPSQYGQLINICANGKYEPTQIWIEQNTGKIAFRGGNGSIVMNDRAFTYVATESSAGIIAGNVSNPSYWWVKLGGTIPLIIQGGITDASIEGSSCNALSFPIAFPSYCMSLTATRWYYNDSSKHAAIVDVRALSRYSATLGGGINDSDGGWYYVTAGKYNWIAFGY